MSTLIIKHKSSNAFFNEQAPGKAIEGIVGDAGVKGLDGKSLYFTNYQLNNSYYQDLCLQRIDSNVVLSNNKSNELGERKYGAGDIIMSSDKELYELFKNNEENAVHKFYLKYIGKIKSKSGESVDMTSRVQSVSVLIDYTDSSRNCMIPSNRNFDTVWGAQDSSCFTLFGCKITPSLNVDYSGTDYEFGLEILLKNEREIILDSYKYLTEENIIDATKIPYFTFYKKIEIPLNINNSTDSSFFISDMVCDKLHPSGNGISSTYMDASNAVDVYSDVDNETIFKYNLSYYDAFNRTEEVHGEQSLLDLFDVPYRHPDASISAKRISDSSNFKNDNWFALNGIDVCSIYNSLYNYDNIKDFTNHLYTVNYRSGESAYFSGIHSGEYGDASYFFDKTSDFINNLYTDDAKEYTVATISNFIFSQDNIYTLIYRNKTNGEVKRINIPYDTINKRYIKPTSE